MSDREQNRPNGRIPARAMYEKSEQDPRMGELGQETQIRAERARVPIDAEPAQRYVPAQTQYVSKRVSRPAEQSYQEDAQSSVSAQGYERRRRSQRHQGDQMDESEREAPRMAPPPRREEPRMVPPPMRGEQQRPVPPPMRVNGDMNRPPMEGNGPMMGQGRPQAPGANYARSSRQEEFAPVRPRQAQPVPDYLEEDDEDKRRGHKGLTVLLVLVLLVALSLGGLFFLLPERDDQQAGGIVNTLNDVKETITDEVGGFYQSVKAIFVPETKELPQITDFQVVPSSGQAPVELAFTITSTKTVEGVRVLDSVGSELIKATEAYVKNENSTIWSMKLVLKDAYTGQMSAQLLSEGNWLDSGKVVEVSIVAPVIAPTETPVVEQPTPEPTTSAMSMMTEATSEPTEEPTEEPTLEPTEEPTPEPTQTPEPTAEPTPSPEPTPEPTPGPTEMPYMQAGAAEGTDPSQLKLTTKIYDGSKALNEFTRTSPVKMSSPDSYANWSGAVLTFRGGPFRQNAAYGIANVQENKLEILWNAPMGGISTYHGAGWTGQPAIVKWPKEIRTMMNLNEEKKAVSALKEVILASQDGKIYFLDLADGQPTRDPINVGFPLKGSVSVDPRGMPMLSIGQGISKIGNTTGDIGFYLFNLIDQKQLKFINGRDKNAYGTNGAFDGTALIDKNSDTMIVAGENGMLYTVLLNATFDPNASKLAIDPKIVSYKSKTAKQKDTQTGVEGSVAMYANYAYFADATGILQCVDVNTMKPVWAVNTDDNTDATIALDFDEDGTLALYTGNTVKEQGKSGICTIRRLNALTGEQEWSYTVNVEFDANEPGGVMASPVVGQQSIGNLVIFTVAKTPEGGQIIAFDKKTGHVFWQQTMSHFSWSSPVAVYNESGSAWIIQGDSEGVLQLMDGQTGAVQNSIQLEGAITGSPAVYNDILVVGTNGKGKSQIYGIKIK